MRYLVLILLLLSFSTAHSAIGVYEFKTPKMEADYIKLTNELRCLVCQNQNLAGSDSDLAKDLRRQTYEMLMEGKSIDQVKEYMAARYGDFVLYRPLLKPGTWLLWLGPFVLIVIVLVLVIRQFRKKQALVPPDEASLSHAKQLLSSHKEQ